MTLTSRQRVLQALVLYTAALGLPGCTEATQAKPPRYDELPGGRYSIVNVPGTQEMLLLDSGSGKSWRLDWSSADDGSTYPSSWSSLDD